MNSSVKQINEALRLTLDKILEYATDCIKGKFSYEMLIDYIISEADRAISLYNSRVKLIIGRPSDILRASLEEIRAEVGHQDINVTPDRIIFLADNGLQLYAYDLINSAVKSS